MREPGSFFDTNVLLYLLSGDPSKAAVAERLLADGGVVSVQVLNEFAAVARRKFKLSWREIRDVLSTVQLVCQVVPLTIETHSQALALAERHALSFYDGLIWAAAQRAGCRLLYSEDMQDGQDIGGILLRNPFTTPSARGR